MSAETAFKINKLAANTISVLGIFDQNAAPLKRRIPHKKEAR